jgi:hypothetical protein
MNKHKPKIVNKTDSKLIRILIELYENNIWIFGNSDINNFVCRMMIFWNGCVENVKDNFKSFSKIKVTTKTLTGFKAFLGVVNLLVNNFTYNKDFLESYEKIFKRAIKRYFNYYYVLNIPLKNSFHMTIIDPMDNNIFKKCLTHTDEQFQDLINTSRRVYRERPENEKSVSNLKEIFIDCFYMKDRTKGKKRFESFRPRFSRWLEILIYRIQKYSNNGKKVELCGLKLTAETQIDVPVIYYYFEWLKNNIFKETIFNFDEMFALDNWNKFIVKFMREERGYSDYWKIVDKN